MSQHGVYNENMDMDVWLRSCKKEIIEPKRGIITGTIPKWLNGTLIRNGPGSVEAGEDVFNHLFDCSAMLHRFNIENGEATYQCRFLQSDSYKKNKIANRIVVTEFGTKASVPDPCHTIFKRFSAVFNFKANNYSDNTLVSVYPFDDELYALTEISIMHKINTDTLDTEEKVDVGDYVAIVNHTAHPHVMSDGSVYNLAMSTKKMGPYHNIVCFPSKTESDTENMFEKAHIVASIRARWPFHPSYMHTFGITDNYFIIVEQPLSLSVPSLIVKRFQNEPLAGSLRWYGNKMTQINVICRKTGNRKYKFFAPAFVYLHIINQYETSNHIVLDVCSYKDASVLDCMYIEAMKNMHLNPNYAEMSRSRSIRFVLPLVNKNEKIAKNQNLVKLSNTKTRAFYQGGKIIVEYEPLCDVGCEFPRINYEKYLGKPYRYFYAISTDVDSKHPGNIIKVDTHNKTILTWCEDNGYPSEPIFIPNPNSKTEDDGILLSALIWGGSDTNRVTLIILNANTMVEIARADFKTMSPVPKCLHGWFLPK